MSNHHPDRESAFERNCQPMTTHGISPRICDLGRRVSSVSSASTGPPHPRPKTRAGRRAVGTGVGRDEAQKSGMKESESEMRKSSDWILGLFFIDRSV